MDLDDDGLLQYSVSGNNPIVVNISGDNQVSFSQPANWNGQETITLGEDLDLHNWILHVGYLSQQPFLFQGTVRDNLTLRVPGATLNEDLVNSLIQKLKLDDCLGKILSDLCSMMEGTT